jgi:hypothetical protein
MSGNDCPLSVMRYSVSIIIVALVVLNILDGDFSNPSTLDYIKFALMAIVLILSIKKGGDVDD